jgi:hypothetical protein
MITVSYDIEFKDVAEKGLVFRMSEGKKAELIAGLQRLKEVNPEVYSKVREALTTITLLYHAGPAGGLASDKLEEFLSNATEEDISKGINNLGRTVCSAEQNLFMILTKYMTHDSNKFGAFYQPERSSRSCPDPLKEIFRLAEDAKAGAPKKGLDQKVSSYRRDTTVI